MAFVRKFDGDLKTSGVQFAEGREAVGLGARYRLRLFLGEYFLDVLDGTPWFQTILGKAPQDVAEAALKQRIFSAPDVGSILRFEFVTERVERAITVTATVRTTAGDDADVELAEDIV